MVPADFRTAWAEVRPCQESAEHDLQFVRVRADAVAAATYGSGGGGALPDGTTVVKEEFLDPGCRTPRGLTAMRKEAGAWRWQKLSVEREVLEDGDLRKCASCHATCGAERRASMIRLLLPVSGRRSSRSGS